ncbi:MAG: hypothetical protein AAGA23_18520 [Pseudomonadota bacterium]
MKTNPILTGTPKALAICAVMIFAGLNPAVAQTPSVILTLDDGPCEVPLQASSAVTVEAASGNITLDVDDTNLPDCFGSPGGAAVDITLNVSPLAIESGESVTANWSVSGYIDGVTTCNISGPSEWIADFNASPEGGSGTYTLGTGTTFNLSCQNAGDSAQAVVTVNGSSGNGLDGFPPPPAVCEPIPAGRELPFRWQAVLEFSTTAGVNYADVWGEWPSLSTNEAIVQVPRGGYVALPFYADIEAGRFWQMRWLGGPNNGNSTQVTISRCPGDFTGTGYTDQLCNKVSGSEGATLLTVTDVNGNGNNLACPIVPGSDEIYYINIRHTNAQGQNECDRPTCDFLGDPRLTN